MDKGGAKVERGYLSPTWGNLSTKGQNQSTVTCTCMIYARMELLYVAEMTAKLYLILRKTTATKNWQVNVNLACT